MPPMITEAEAEAARYRDVALDLAERILPGVDHVTPGMLWAEVERLRGAPVPAVPCDCDDGLRFVDDATVPAPSAFACTRCVRGCERDRERTIDQYGRSLRLYPLLGWEVAEADYQLLRRLHNEASSRVADASGPAGSAMRLRREVSTLRAQVRDADRALATANERTASLEDACQRARLDAMEATALLLDEAAMPDAAGFVRRAREAIEAALTPPVPKTEET